MKLINIRRFRLELPELREAVVVLRRSEILGVYVPVSDNDSYQKLVTSISGEKVGVGELHDPGDANAYG